MNLGTSHSTVVLRCPRESEGVDASRNCELCTYKNLCCGSCTVVSDEEERSVRLSASWFFTQLFWGRKSFKGCFSLQELQPCCGENKAVYPTYLRQSSTSWMVTLAHQHHGFPNMKEEKEESWTFLALCSTGPPWRVFGARSTCRAFNTCSSPVLSKNLIGINWITESENGLGWKGSLRPNSSATGKVASCYRSDCPGPQLVWP